MALQSNDLFVVQSQTDSQLYKLKLSDLDIYLEGSSGIQFRGSVDLNDSAAAQTPAVTLPAANGDLYIVETDAAAINADWIMESGVTSASENDRIIWDADSSYWVLVAGGTSTGGTITNITATLPLESDGDPVNPVLTINEASTTEDGSVRLATAAETEAGIATNAAITPSSLRQTFDSPTYVIDGGAIQIDANNWDYATA